MRRLLVLIILVLACGPTPATQTAVAQGVIICPEGSVFDPQLNLCIAKAQLTTSRTPSALGSTPTIASSPPSASASTVAIAPVVSVSPLPATPPLPAGGTAVDVTCAFSHGWVTVMPVSAYPRDDQFLMQALIGFSNDPSFWNKEHEYLPIKPYAAKPCTSAVTRFVVAPGDVYVLAGQEGTFNTKGTYDKNGVKQRMTVTGSTTVSLTNASLTHTWLCISCPWVSFVGSDVSPFVVLAWRNDAHKRGSDRKLVRQIPVKNGQIAVRVSEREDEETRLDQLVLVVKDTAGNSRVVMPVGGERSALASDDGTEVRMSKGSEIAVHYDMSWLMMDGAVDVELVASGYYVPMPEAP